MLSGIQTNYWVPFWALAIKFWQNGLACHLIFSTHCRLIIFYFHHTMWQPFSPNTLPSPLQYRYPVWLFPPLRYDVFSKCSLIMSSVMCCSIPLQAVTGRVGGSTTSTSYPVTFISWMTWLGADASPCQESKVKQEVNSLLCRGQRYWKPTEL